MAQSPESEKKLHMETVSNFDEDVSSGQTENLCQYLWLLIAE